MGLARDVDARVRLYRNDKECLGMCGDAFECSGMIGNVLECVGMFGIA